MEEHICGLEWPHDRKQTLCPLHRCELPQGHGGYHKCGMCGWTRRNMERDGPMYKVQTSYTVRGSRKFATLDEAKAFCEKVYSHTGVVLAIIKEE